MVYLIGLVLLLGLITYFGIYAKKHAITLESKKIYRILGYCLLGVLLLKSSSRDSFVYCINGGSLYGVEGTKPDIPEMLIRYGLLWSECLVFSLIVCDNKVVKWLLSKISIFIIPVATIYFYWSVKRYLVGYEFGFALMPRVLAAILLVFEYAIIYAESLYIRLFDEVKLTDACSKNSFIKFLVITLLVCIPMQLFPAIFGETSIEMNVFNLAHIGWIVSIIVVFTLLVVLFKNESKDIKLSLISVIIFYLFMHYNNAYKVGLDINRLPIQLCNIASYLFVVIILTKSKSLFNFLYIANPVGALIAIFTLADRSTIFSFWIIHYMIEHLYVFVIPLLLVIYGVFERPKLKVLLKDYFFWFSIYFFSCLIVNCFVNGVLYTRFGENSDFVTSINAFYLLECPVKDVLPFYSDLEVGKVSLFGQQFYIIYVLFIYVVFTLLSFLLYYIMEGCFKLGQIIPDLKKKLTSK